MGVNEMSDVDPTQQQLSPDRFDTPDSDPLAPGGDDLFPPSGGDDE